MKKAISILFVLVIVLSLCACGENNISSKNNTSESKYVGTYKNDDWEYTTREGLNVQTVNEMVLNADGTGTSVLKSTSSHPHFLYGKASISEGDVLISSELTWKVMDGYLVINATGKRYFKIDESILLPAIGSLDSQGISFTTSMTCELKGNVLEIIHTDDYYAETGLGYSTKID